MILLDNLKNAITAFMPGNKIPTPADVKDRQTEGARVEWLYREFAGHPSRGMTPAKLAAVFQEAEEGNLRAQAELFMDMREKDAHIDAEMNKRIMAVKQLDFRLEPPRNPSATEKKNTLILENLIRDEIDISAVKMDMLDAIGHAYSCIELGWTQNLQGIWYPNQLEHREADWFVTPYLNRNTLHLRNVESFYGEPLQPFGWIPHIHRSRSGYLPRAGLFRSLAWPYLYKNYSVRDLAEFLEIYGLPIRLGKYNPNASEQEKMDLLRTVMSIGHNAAGIIPDTMQIELATVISQGNATNFKAMIDWAEEKISMAILGGTLTSKTGANGNRSLGDVHNEVRMDIRDDDATQIDFSLSKYLIFPMGMLNGWFAENRTPRFVSDTQDPEDITIFGDAIPKLVGAGARIPINYVNEKLKIPIPADGEKILAVSPTSTPTANLDSANTDNASLATAKLTSLLLADKASQIVALKGNPTDSQDIDPTPVSSQSDQLAIDAAPSIKAMVDQIRTLVDQAETLEELRDTLLSSYGHIDNTKLINVMQIAFATADLAGRFDVTHED